MAKIEENTDTLTLNYRLNGSPFGDVEEIEIIGEVREIDGVEVLAGAADGEIEEVG